MESMPDADGHSSDDFFGTLCNMVSFRQPLPKFTVEDVAGFDNDILTT